MKRAAASTVQRIALASALLAGCGDDADGFGPPRLRDVADAPPAIQRAAQAIVRVRGARGAGTGSFISPDGLLLTNNHVLGNRVCPIEGCWFELTFNHQRGQTSQEPQTVFGVPLHVDVGLDMAILQIYAQSPASDANRLATPNYLSFVPYEAVDLVGKHVTVVGHPEARLKKWASGVVIDVSGVWFESTVFILPGDSGSPLLDDDGKLIGLMHRSADAADLLTSSGYLSSSLGTASAPLIAAMDAPLPASMISIAADATPDDIVENNAVYLNGRAQSVPVQGVATSVISLLAQACDQGLARTNYLSPEDLTSALTPCDDAQVWIDCRQDVDPAAFGVVCPDSDLSGWAARFQAMNERQRALNGQLLYDPISFGIAQLSPSLSAGFRAGALSLQQALDQAEPILDFELAFYLAAFNIDSYANKPIPAFVAAYRNVPHYQRYAQMIALSALWLNSHSRITGAMARALLDRLAGDANVDIGDKLAIEEYLYNAGAL